MAQRYVRIYCNKCDSCRQRLRCDAFYDYYELLSDYFFPALYRFQPNDWPFMGSARDAGHNLEMTSALQIVSHDDCLSANVHTMQSRF